MNNELLVIILKWSTSLNFKKFDTIEQLRVFTVIDLSNEYITLIPESINKLQQLKIHDLSGNALNKFPIILLTNLQPTAETSFGMPFPDFLIPQHLLTFEAKGTVSSSKINSMLKQAYSQISRYSLNYYGGISCFSIDKNLLVVDWIMV